MALVDRSGFASNTRNASSTVDFASGWAELKTKGIERLHSIVESGTRVNFDKKAYMQLYTTVYNMCTQNAPHNWSGKLYACYGGSLEEYMTNVVRPAIENRAAKQDSLAVLAEVGRRWNNHKLISRWLRRFFTYVDRFYVRRNGFKSLVDVADAKFRDLVFGQTKGTIRKCLLDAIDRERTGHYVDRDLLRANTLLMVEMGRENPDNPLCVYQVKHTNEDDDDDDD